MKRLKLIISLLLLFSAAVSAADLTPVQEKALRSVYAYLAKEKYEPSVDTSDNSVCFKRNKVFYWITFEGDSPLLYTFHRKAFKVGEEIDTYKRNPSIIACNEVNRKHKTLKLTVEEKKVDIAIQAYAVKPEDFIAVIPTYMSQFSSVYDDFKNEYEKALVAEQETLNRLEQESKKNLPPSVLRNHVSSISFRLLDADGSEKAAYDQPLRSYDAKYIQARLTFKAWAENDKDFKLQMKVTRPNGKVIYLPGKKVTAEMPVILKKSKKPQIVEFDQFGSAKEGFWKAGEYRVEVIESGDVIYTTTFNIL